MWKYNSWNVTPAPSFQWFTNTATTVSNRCVEFLNSVTVEQTLVWFMYHLTNNSLFSNSLQPIAYCAIEETRLTHTQPFYSPLSTWVSRYQKKRSSTHTPPAHRHPYHLPPSTTNHSIILAQSTHLAISAQPLTMSSSSASPSTLSMSPK